MQHASPTSKNLQSHQRTSSNISLPSRGVVHLSLALGRACKAARTAVCLRLAGQQDAVDAAAGATGAIAIAGPGIRVRKSCHEPLARIFLLAAVVFVCAGLCLVLLLLQPGSTHTQAIPCLLGASLMQTCERIEQSADVVIVYTLRFIHQTLPSLLVPI